MHGKSSTTRVLDCVTEWRMRNITDTGLACIGTALTTNSTLKVLTLGTWFLNPNATDKGLMPFLEGLQKNQSLESLSICWSSTHPDQSFKQMGKSVVKSSLKQLNMAIALSWQWLQTEETIKDWAQSVQVGVTDLIQSLECHQLKHLRLDIQCIVVKTVKHVVHQVMNSVVDSLDAHVKLVNSKRQAKGFLPITKDPHQQKKMFFVFLKEIFHGKHRFLFSC